MNRRFLRDFLALSLLFGTIIACAYSFLARIGEIDIDGVIERQLAQKDRILFASGLSNDMFDYKSLMHARIQPAVVVAGSSRAMEVRAAFFDKPMFNWGGTVSSLAKLEAVTGEILRQRRLPQYVLVFVDIWWMNARLIGPDTTYARTPYPAFPDALTIMKTFGIVSRDYSRVMSAALAGNSDRLGLYAMMKDDGFAADGSWYYSGMVSRRSAGNEQDIGQQLRTVDTAAAAREKFSFLAEHDGDEALQQRLIAIVGALRSKSITPIVVLPPLDKPVRDYLAGVSRPDRFKSMAARFERAGIEFHDFTDASALQPDTINKACEFLDDFHGGDVLNARIFSKIWATTGDAGLKASLNRTFLDGFTRDKAGFAEGDDRYRRGKPEVNFRGIPCHA